MIITSTLLAVLATACIAEAASRPRKGYGSLWRKECPPNQVLSIFALGKKSFATQCGQPRVCDEFVPCYGNSAGVCGALGGFMRKAEEQNDGVNGVHGSVRSSCCAYPKPEKEENMFEFCSVFNLYHGIKTADVFNFPIRMVNPNPTMLVKSITKTPSGYMVTYCTLRCTRTTTSTPSTPTPRSPPRLFEDLIRELQGDLNPASQGEHAAATHIETGGGTMCFAGDQTVITRNGVKRMDQIEEGDQVLTHSYLFDGPIFERVDWFMHRNEKQWAKFIVLATDRGYSIKLTPKHLLPIVPCDYDSYSMPDRYINRYWKKAEDAKIGSCVLVNDASYPVQSIKSIDIINQQGIYSPFTSHGSIIVNGIYASCQSAIGDYQSFIQTSMINIIIPIYRRIQAFLGAGACSNVDIPGLIKLFMDASSVV